MMKERLANVLAWGVWLWALGYTLFAAVMTITGEACGERGCVGHPALMALMVVGIAMGPVAAQWLLLYILNGSPRWLPWSK